MLREEAGWIRKQLELLPITELSPLLDIGSGTKSYRTTFHPWLQSEIMEPLQARGCAIVHTDIQSGEGVDIAGDLTDPAFLNELRAMRFRSVVCGNLFEHVPNREEIANILVSIIPVGGYLIATGPRRFPYHPNPIDTGFRPTVDELFALFPGTVMLSGAVVEGQRILTIQARENSMSLIASLIRTFARIAFPFYHPVGWLAAVRKVPWLGRRAAATAVVLRKTT